MSDAATIEHAARLLGPAAVRDEPIGARTTYRVGGRAALFVEVESAERLALVTEAVRESGIELLILGRGSNLLVADEGFPGLCVTLGGEFEQLAEPEVGAAPGASGSVEAGGALFLPVLARRLAALGVGGLSWAVGIPGSVGGAVAGNAGGHGSEIASELISAEVVDLSSGERRVAAADELDLSYRHSAIGATELVLGARFAVWRGDAASLQREIDEIVAWRREHQPGGRNAGSVFRNPPGDAAGRLLDLAGAKGLRHGSAEVSTKHANFIGVDPGGRADDVLALTEVLRALVLDRFGVELQLELRPIGFRR
jgi:UDP-N-acetylmuramate dehydrogenase